MLTGTRRHRLKKPCQRSQTQRLSRQGLKLQRIVMLRSLPGRLLLIALVALASCRSDNPPSIDICIGDGFGGADCLLKDGTKIYLKPSQLKNAWISNQEDMKAFTSWCYDTTKEAVDARMKQLTEELGHGPNAN